MMTSATSVAKIFYRQEQAHLRTNPEQKTRAYLRLAAPPSRCNSRTDTLLPWRTDEAFAQWSATTARDGISTRIVKLAEQIRHLKY